MLRHLCTSTATLLTQALAMHISSLQVLKLLPKTKQFQVCALVHLSSSLKPLILPVRRIVMVSSSCPCLLRLKPPLRAVWALLRHLILLNLLPARQWQGLLSTAVSGARCPLVSTLTADVEAGPTTPAWFLTSTGICKGGSWGWFKIG